MGPVARVRGWSCNLWFSTSFFGTDSHEIHSLHQVVPPLVNPSGFFCTKQKKGMQTGHLFFKLTLEGSIISKHHSSAGTVFESQRPLYDYNLEKPIPTSQLGKDSVNWREAELQHFLWAEGRNRERRSSFMTFAKSMRMPTKVSSAAYTPCTQAGTRDER